MENRARILVVDDEPSIRGILTETLGQLGHEVMEAGSAEEALQQMAESFFHLILTDIRMPGLTGIDLLGRIKQKGIETEVIIMTSNASVDSAIQAIRLGAANYLLKPFEELEYIEMVVQRALDKQFLKRQNQELLSHLKQKNEELVRATQRAAQILADNNRYHGINREILEAEDRDDLLKRFEEVLTKFFRGKPFLLWLYAPEARALKIQKGPEGAADLKAIPLPDASLKTEAGPALWLSKKGYLPALAREPFLASGFIDLPLVFQEKGFGLLALLQSKPEDLASHEAAFLNHLATVVSAMLRQFQQRFGGRTQAPLRPEECRIPLQDSATSLHHFDYFLEILSREIARSRRYRHPFTLLMAALNPPIDPEKDPKGRSLFVSLAEALQSRIRATDVATRFGHKFFILLPETDRENSKKVCRAIDHQIAEIARAGGKNDSSGGWNVELASVEYPKDADTVEGLIGALEISAPH